MKPGWKSTEFVAMVVVQAVGLLATMGVFTSDQASAITEATPKIFGLIAMVGASFGYSLSRGSAKRDSMSGK